MLAEAMRRKHLAMALSRLPAHPQHSAALEQYATDGEVAATWLCAIRDYGDFVVHSEEAESQERAANVVDLGSGNGVLGLAALLCGARHATLIEIDEECCEISATAADRLELTERITIVRDRIMGNWPPNWQSGDSECDLIIMNPPWGKQTLHADRMFLNSAFASPAKIIHLLHSRKATHIENAAEVAGWTAVRWLESELPLPAAYSHHTQRRGVTGCAMWRITRT
jgi:putative methylase